MTSKESKSKDERTKHIQIRNNKHWVVIRERHHPDQKSKPIWHGPFADLDGAIAYRDQRVKELEGGEAIEKTSLTLSSYLRRWLDDHAVIKPLKRTTQSSYLEKIVNYIDPSIGAMKLQEIRPHDLKSWTADLMRTGGRKKAGLSPATVRKVGVIVKEALVAAVDEYGYLSTNPAANLKLPRASRRTGAVWTVEEAKKFSVAAAENRLTALFALLIATGARRGESLALTWDDLDLEVGTVRINKGVTWVGGVREIGTTKTEESRTVPIDPHTVIALRSHRARQVQERLVATSWQDEDLVFCRPDGSPLAPDFAYRQFTRLIEEAGVPKIRLHDLRHTHATWLLDAGEQLHVVAERLGHADSSTTSTIYAHSNEKQRRRAAETFQRIVEGS